jgi:hypothetical protein
MAQVEDEGVRAADVEFVVVAEAGPLERQAMLLVESLRQFGGGLAGAAVTVVSPRPDRRPSAATAVALGTLGCELVALDVDSRCPSYGTSWRLHSMAAIERRGGPPVLVQLDSDTLFLDDVDLLPAEADLAARPVDVKSMTSTGPSDPNDRYWRALCGLVGVDLDDLPLVTSTVDRVRVRASYNGGFVVARREHGLFAVTEEVFRRGVEADLRPHAGSGINVRSGTGDVGLIGSEWWGSAQAALSVAAAKLQLSSALLAPSVNVPLHLWDDLPAAPDRLCHVHYHWLLEPESLQRNPLLDGRIEIRQDVADWLDDRLPR